MVKVLRSYGIHDKLVNEINGSYANTRAKVNSLDGVSEEIDRVAGVIRGDALSPYHWFIIILDYALRKAINGRRPSDLTKNCNLPLSGAKVGDCILTDSNRFGFF